MLPGSPETLRSQSVRVSMWLWLAPGALLVFGAACSAHEGPTPDPAATVRGESLQEVAYDLKTPMRRLARHVEELELIMWRDTPLEAEDHARARLILKQMADVAMSLDADALDHAGVVRALPELQHDLARALADTTLDPPNYFFAGEVPGACTYCHEPRYDRGPVPWEEDQP